MFTFDIKILTIIIIEKDGLLFFGHTVCFILKSTRMYSCHAVERINYTVIFKLL